MYKIQGWFPTVGQMGGCGFNIILTPKWKEAVSKSILNQDKIDCLINNIGEQLLEGHGRRKSFTNIRCDLRIKWGEWGVEHITVPGDACGLDISTCTVGCKEGEVMLVPHNVDSISQASMILALFLQIAEILELGI